VSNVGIKPLLAPISPEDLHPSNPILAHSNNVERTSAGDDPVIQKTVDYLDQNV
jgi:hypothetical protein